MREPKEEKLREVYKDYLNQPNLLRSKTTFESYLRDTRYKGKPGHHLVNICTECGFKNTTEFKQNLSKLTL